MGIAEDVAEILCARYPGRRSGYEKALAAMEQRLSKRGDEVAAEVRLRRLEGAGVLASDHQSEFSRWLGLDVISTFNGRDVETAAGLNRRLRQVKGRPIRFVIANKQEGTGLAEALAERLDAKVVVFGNFPDTSPGKNDCHCFDRLLQENALALFKEADR
jgi:ABC-type Zn uptake system ZnuABC Zn-binding protein ZnuA